MLPICLVKRFMFQEGYPRRFLAYSTMAITISAPVGDDLTIDELMDAVDDNSDWRRVRSGNGFTEEHVEVDPRKRFEELIAPELLFPDEVDASK